MYTVVSIIEDGKLAKFVAPYHWLKTSDMVLMHPPKGMRVGEVIAKWIPPTKDWLRYTVTKILFNYGTKSECDEFLANYQDSSCTEVDDEDSDATVSPAASPSPKKRKLSPKITSKNSVFEKVKQTESSYPLYPQSLEDSTNVIPPSQSILPPSFLDFQLSMLSTPKRKEPTIVRRSPRRHTPPSLLQVGQSRIGQSSPRRLPTTPPLLQVSQSRVGRPLGDGADKFKELENKAFQYQVLMRIGYLEGIIAEQSKKIDALGHRVDNKDSPAHFDRIKTYEEFLVFDGSLKEDGVKKIFMSQLKRIGSKPGDMRRSLKMVLDFVMDPSVQCMFNRDGGKRIKEVEGKLKKKAFGETNVYRCIQDVLSGEGFSIIAIWGEIGNVLKKVRTVSL